MAKTVAYSLSQEAALPKPHWTDILSFLGNREAEKIDPKSLELSLEDVQIVAALNDAAGEMAYIHSCFDHITEELLIDCLIYELKAVSLRHKYFLGLCKEKGIISGNPAV